MRVYNQQTDRKLTKDLIEKLAAFRARKAFNAQKYLSDKANIINTYMSKCKLDSCVVAISGGIDSAVVLGLLLHTQKQVNSPIKKVIPVLLPISDSTGVTNQDSATQRGVELCDKLGVMPYILDLAEINRDYIALVDSMLGIKGGDWAIGQLGPITRTPVLYYITNLLNQEGCKAIVCGTTNRTEGSYLGYVGKASDGMVDVQIISDLYKSEVYAVAEALGIPQSIIDITPTGDMYDGRVDEEVFGASYDFTELYLSYLKLSPWDQEIFEDDLTEAALKQFKMYGDCLENLHRYNAHKYLSKSPAVHLDLWDCSLPGGWVNYYQITKEFLICD